MKEIYTADCESDPFKHGRIPKPFIWGAYNGCDYNEFKSTDDFIDFIAQKDCIVYAHNGGKFDWHYVLHRLDAFDEITVIAGRLAKFKIGNAEFRDSMNILPMALKQFKKDDFDYTILEKDQRDKPHNKIKISNYLRNDCVYLHEIVSRFIDEYGEGLTIAGTALKQWQKISKQKPPRTDAEFYDDFKPFYYGGRVECFQDGIMDKPFSMIDINSAYPDAMMHNHPYGQTYTTKSVLPSTDAYIQRSFITLETISHGALPFREKDGLVFPDDNEKRTYFITGWEYLAAIKHNKLSDIKILECITFSDSINFRDYVDHFYEMKKYAKEIGDLAKELFAKLFLNSLYGKMAADPRNYDDFTVVEPRFIHAAESDGYSFCNKLGEWALMGKPIDDYKHHFYNVAVGASITGFVRAKMLDALSQCDGLIYCDTDSIAAEHIGKGIKIDPYTLGEWDIEAHCDYGGVAGKKLYAFRDKHKFKTVDKEADAYKTASKGVRLDYKAILKLAKGIKQVYRPEAPTYSIKSGIRFTPRTVTKNAKIQKKLAYH